VRQRFKTEIFLDRVHDDVNRQTMRAAKKIAECDQPSSLFLERAHDDR